MRLASLHSYPVKGCHRLDHDEAWVEPWGLAGDRRWLIADWDGTAVTQREVARLGQIRAIPTADGLLLRATGADDCPVPRPDPGELMEVAVHRSRIPATPAGSCRPPAGAAERSPRSSGRGRALSPDEWLTALLDRKVRLVWLDDPTRRPTNPQYSTPADRVSFADGYPLLLTNAASLDALNDWLAESGSPEWPLPMNRFRPNVVVSGAPAWAEDGWPGRRIRIGELAFRVVKPSDRCVVTTTDQETGQRGHEPLRVLARHRNRDNKLLFGVNLIPDGTGPIRVGASIQALEKLERMD